MTEWGIDTLFNPGKRHMDEEKRRLQSTREEVGDSSGGKRIDLESGIVKIGRPKQPATGDGTPAAEAQSSEAPDDEAPSAEAPDAESAQHPTD